MFDGIVLTDNDEIEPMLLTSEQVAGMLQISKRSLWRLRSAHEIPEPVRLGATVRWRTDEIKNWIASGCRKPGIKENERGRK